MPVPTPTATWRQVKFDINAGQHLIQWRHATIATTSLAAPGYAFLDGLETTAVSSLSLAEAVMTTPATWPSSSVSAAKRASPWRAVRYQEADGSWVRAELAVGAAGELSVMVNGPAVVEFNGRCFDATPKPKLASGFSSSIQSSVVVIYPGFETTVLGHFLTGFVDCHEQLRIAIDETAKWSDGAMHIPVGLHQVAFRLRTGQSNLFRESIVDATDASLQGWVREMRVVSAASRFENWKSAHKLSFGMHADSDGDGDGGFYRICLRHRSPRRRVEATKLADGIDSRIEGEDGNAILSGGEIALSALPHFRVVQSSTELLHWENEAVRLPHYPPMRSYFILTQNPGNPSLPVPVDSPQKYYRIRISDDAE